MYNVDTMTQHPFELEVIVRTTLDADRFCFDTETDVYITQGSTDVNTITTYDDIEAFGEYNDDDRLEISYDISDLHKQIKEAIVAACTAERVTAFTACTVQIDNKMVDLRFAL